MQAISASNHTFQISRPSGEAASDSLSADSKGSSGSERNISALCSVLGLAWVAIVLSNIVPWASDSPTDHVDGETLRLGFQIRLGACRAATLIVSDWLIGLPDF